MSSQGGNLRPENEERPLYGDQEVMENPSQYVHNHWAPWDIYGIAFSSKKTEPFRLAVGSLLDSETNYVGYS